MPVYRHDLVEIKSPKIDQNGYLVADAFPTKTGVFKYVKPDGTITHELRHEDDVFKPESLNSLKNRPIVDEHSGLLNSNNTRGQDRGHVGESIERLDNHVKANLIVTDSALIEKMQGGKRELSCGYTADVIPQVGVTPNGQKFDHRQTNIIYNHLAVVHQGRAGPTAQIHLDSQDAASFEFSPEPQKQDNQNPDGAKTMTIKQTLNAVTHGDFRQDEMTVEYSEDSSAVVDSVISRLNQSNAQIKVLQDAGHTLKKEKEKVEGERDQAKKDLENKKDDHAQLDQLADERADIKGVANYLKVEKFDGKSNTEIKAMIVSKHNPDLKLDGLSEGNIEGRYDMIVETIKSDLKSKNQNMELGRITSPNVAKNDAATEPVQDFRQDGINKGKLSHGLTEAQAKAAHAKYDENQRLKQAG